MVGRVDDAVWGWLVHRSLYPPTSPDENPTRQRLGRLTWGDGVHAHRHTSHVRPSPRHHGHHGCGTHRCGPTRKHVHGNVLPLYTGGTSRPTRVASSNICVHKCRCSCALGAGEAEYRRCGLPRAPASAEDEDAALPPPDRRPKISRLSTLQDLDAAAPNQKQYAPWLFCLACATR